MIRRRSIRAAGPMAAVALLVVALTGTAALGAQVTAKVQLADAVTNAGLTLQPPEGWTVEAIPSPPSLVIAEQAGDIASEVPAGARLTARPVTGAALSGDELLAELDQSPLVGGVKVFKTKVGGTSASGIELTTDDGTAVTTRWIFVSLGDGRAYAFELEAPQQEFKGLKKTLSAVLKSVEFDVASIPAAG